MCLKFPFDILFFMQILKAFHAEGVQTALSTANKVWAIYRASALHRRKKMFTSTWEVFTWVMNGENENLVKEKLWKVWKRKF